MIVGGIIFTITFWKYHANMIILREIQQGMFKVKFFFEVLIHAFCTLNILNIIFLNFTFGLIMFDTSILINDFHTLNLQNDLYHFQ
jgi:hypothetical protein